MNLSSGAAPFILYHPSTAHQGNYRNFHLPLSIVSIAAALPRSTPSLLLDNNVLCSQPENLWLPPASQWAAVGVSVMIGHQIKDALTFSRYVRSVAPACPIIWGGACPTLLPDLVIGEQAADWAVIGPGEDTIKGLCEVLKGSRDPTTVDGLCFSLDGRIVTTNRSGMVDLDDQPAYYPYIEEIGLEHYVRSDEHIGSRTLSYHSSQGCPYACGFCCEPVLWNHSWAGMSAERMMLDLDRIIRQHDIDGIKFYDSEFFVNRRRTLRLAECILQRELRIRWGASIHPANLLRFSEDELKLLRASGLSRLLIGAETAVESELKLVGKRTTPEQAIRCAHICAMLDISASFTFVTGYPGSPCENIDRTLELAEKLVGASPLHEAKIHFFGPYPGTPLYPLAIANGFAPPTTLQAWADFDYYLVQTPWIPDHYYQRVRSFNEHAYPYLIGVAATASAVRED